MSDICQTHFPPDLSQPRPLPGIAPLDPDGWITVDEVYAQQMARRRELLKTHRATVLATCPGSEDAQTEACEAVLSLLGRRSDFQIDQTAAQCPDGRRVPLDGPPLDVINELVQEDIILMQRWPDVDEHVLTAGLLCFPASWLLTEKLGRPLMGVHEPVVEYEAVLGKRVQRLFDGVKEGRPLWRFNKLWYADADLFQPRAENERRTPVSGLSYNYLRMEKQSLVRLPRTNAVIFAIHTYVLHRKDVPKEIEARFTG